ncbi:MAG: Hpt domain-containing protein [Pseudobutyrivibrio sp.]|nr:Hpt domain-containing protein [Pseudobutyrivibrio sp.]
MEIEKFAAVGIDYAQGLERCLGDGELYRKFLGMFRDDNTFSKIKPAMDQGDVNAAFKAAHDLKGVAVNLSLNTLYERAASFTDALRDDGDLDLARQLYPALAEAYEMVVEALR